jgi:hypothetical protein
MHVEHAPPVISHECVAPAKFTAAHDPPFPDWALGDVSARAWMWTQQELDNGAVGRATEEEIVAEFDRLAAEPAESGCVKTA